MMRTIALSCLLLLVAGQGSAQQKHKPPHKRKHHPYAVEAPPPPKIFRYVEQRAAFRGNAAEYILQHLRYPDEARENGITGRVEVMFEVGGDGTVRVMMVLHSSGSTALDAEACRVVRSMPAWSPGKVNGKPVKCIMVLPVIFKLEQ